MHHADRNAHQGFEANIARADALNKWLIANRIDPKATRDYVPAPGPVGRNVFKVAAGIVLAVTIAGATLGHLLNGNLARLVSSFGL